MPLEILTHTKRRDYKNCHRYYLHRHVEHLQPRIQKKGRRRGTIFGETIERVRRHVEAAVEKHLAGPLDIDEEYQSVIDAHVNEAYEKLFETGDFIDGAEAQALEIEEAKMHVLVSEYIKRYGVDRRREVEFYLPLRNPRTGRTSRAFRLGGKIDGVCEVGQDADGFFARLVEDKLVEQIQKVQIERLPLDDQISEYVDAFVSRGWRAHVEYRHTRWPGINPTKEKVLKTKTNPAETLDQFAIRLREDIRSRLEFYFDKQDLYFPLDHLEDYRLGRWQTAQDILASRRNGSWYMNPSRCWEYGGCEFIPLCTKQPGARDLYVVGEDSPELHGKETSG